MKRTVTANISGIVFHIEEDAYRNLETYMKRIREHLAQEEGLDEIMQDIEARIAELFKEATKDHKEVVTEQDVEEVIETLGQPSDFSEGGEAEEERSEEGTDRTESADPAKRIYRDPDDKVLGGVCSGISAYLGWDPVWLRLIFVLATLLGGTGPVLYIILWVIVPEAHTRAEKLHMRGEAVNLDNLKKKVKEEGEELKDRFGRFKKGMEGEKVKGEGRKSGQKLKEVLHGIFYWVLKAGQKIGGLFLILFGAVFALILLMAFGGGGDHFIFVHTPEANYTFNEFLNSFIPDLYHQVLFKTGFALTFGIPVIFFFYTGTKTLFEIDRKLKGLGPTLFILWILGLIGCLYASAFWLGANMMG